MALLELVQQSVIHSSTTPLYRRLRRLLTSSPLPVMVC